MVDLTFAPVCAASPMANVRTWTPGPITASAKRSDRRRAAVSQPIVVYDTSFKSSAVNLGRTVSSILFSRNEGLILFEAKPPQQPPRSMAAPLLAHLAMILIETACLG